MIVVEYKCMFAKKSDREGDGEKEGGKRCDGARPEGQVKVTAFRTKGTGVELSGETPPVGLAFSATSEWSSVGMTLVLQMNLD